MIPREYERLLQAELDGENTPAESARLRDWLARSPEGRARRAELEAMFRVVARVGPVEVPADLRQAVLEAIAAGQADAPPAPGWRESFAAALGRRPGLRRAATLAAGVVLGIAAVSLVGRWPAGPGREPLAVSGTLLPATAASGRTVGDRHILTADGLSFALETNRTGAEAELRLEGGPAGRVLVALDFDRRRLAVAGVDWADPAGAALRSGPGRLELDFAPFAPAVVRLRVTGGGDAEIRVRLHAAGRTARVRLHTGEAAMPVASP